MCQSLDSPPQGRHFSHALSRLTIGFPLSAGIKFNPSNSSPRRISPPLFSQTPPPLLQRPPPLTYGKNLIGLFPPAPCSYHIRIHPLFRFGLSHPFFCTSPLGESPSLFFFFNLMVDYEGGVTRQFLDSASGCARRTIHLFPQLQFPCSLSSAPIRSTLSPFFSFKTSSTPRHHVP